MVVLRGEVWLANHPKPVGSGPGFERPLLIIQTNPFNASRIATVVAAVITSNLRLADAPGNVLIPADATALPRDSVVNVSQLVTINKQVLGKRVCRLEAPYMQQVEEGFKMILGL